MSEFKEIREKVLVNLKEVAEQNKVQIEDAYQRVMRLEHIARREGILALEYEAEFIPREVPLCNRITEMIEMVVDGTEPQIFEELMTIKFFAVHNYTDIEALLYFLYARSMLMIQAGESPRMIEELFCAVIPERVITFKQKRMMVEEDKKQKIHEWKNKLTKEEKEILNDISIQLKDLSEEEWKLVVGSNGFYGFDKVLPYLDEDTQALVERYMNDYRYYVIMRNSGAVTGRELLELAKELEKIIRRLRNKEKTKGILDDVLKCDDKEIQLLLRNLDNYTLAVALKGVDAEVAECFSRNLSQRLRSIVQEAMEDMGALCIRDVEAAQEKIYRIAKDVLGWKA